MPAIGDLQYGYDAAGLETYLDEIKTIVLTEAVEALKDYSGIKNVCDAHWAGQAKDNFLTNVGTDIEHVCVQLDELYQILEKEIRQAQYAMGSLDRTLIQ